MSAIRQNYDDNIEALVNKQINKELYASYVYLAMAYHFDRHDVSLKNFSKFFKEESGEERKHAQMFMEYQNLRGGRILLQDVKAPALSEWTSHIHALEDALALEKEVNQSILDLHTAASQHNDPHMTSFLDTHFVDEQVEASNKLAKLITSAKHCGEGLGAYQFDLHTMSSANE